MNIINFPAVKSRQACQKFEFCFDSHAVNTFAATLCLDDSAEGRTALGQPVVVELRRGRKHWRQEVEALARSADRMVIAIDEMWLENFDEDGIGQMPMAVAYELVDGQLVGTPVSLHHNHRRLARLFAADLTRAWSFFHDSSGRWEMLGRAWASKAAIGIQRAGERWFWHHDELTTEDYVTVMHEMDTEERLGLRRPLPGVVLNLGRR